MVYIVIKNIRWFTNMCSKYRTVFHIYCNFSTKRWMFIMYFYIVLNSLFFLSSIYYSLSFILVALVFFFETELFRLFQFQLMSQNRTATFLPCLSYLGLSFLKFVNIYQQILNLEIQNGFSESIVILFFQLLRMKT